MDAAVSTNLFPSKLWRLVNNPWIGAIRWDSGGELIVIDQQVFQAQLLSTRTNRSEGFKTTNYSSFVRQLNLYGFRKADPPLNQRDVRDDRPYQYFYNPNFKRNHPELVANLRRLTVGNKAKLEAGLDVKSRLTNQHRLSGGDRDAGLKRKSSPLQPTRPQAPPPPGQPYPTPALTPQISTPVPPRYQARGPSDAPVFAPVQHIPVSLRHRYSGGASNSMQVQQGLLSRANSGNPPFTRFNPQNAQYQPPYYPSVCQCCTSGLVQPNLQTEFFSAHRFYQGTENQEAQKSDVNLDAIFQIADEMMQTSSGAQMVKIQTLKRPVSVLKSSPGSCKAVPRDNTSSSAAHKDESVASVPEQIPEDAICEASADQEKDAEIIIVEVSDQMEAVSQK